MKCQLFSCFFFNRDSRTFRTNTPIKWLSLSMMFILIVLAPALQGAAAPSSQLSRSAQRRRWPPKGAGTARQ